MRSTWRTRASTRTCRASRPAARGRRASGSPPRVTDPVGERSVLLSEGRLPAHGQAACEQNRPANVRSRAMSVTTRRRFLQTTSTFAAVAALGTRRPQPASSRRVLAYAGTYSSPGGGAPGRGEGIHILEMDPASGALTQRDVVRTAANPSWLAFD